MMRACSQTEACSEISASRLFLLQGALSVCMEIWHPLRVYLQTPFCIVPPNPLMEEYTHSMSSVRISVEWIFGDIINYFKFVDFKKDLKTA